MNLRYTGQVDFGDMHTAFGLQVQPAISLTDFLYAMPPEGAGALDGVKVDIHHGCVYAKPIWVPHNQRIRSTDVSVIDDDEWLLEGLPSLVWDEFRVVDASTEDSLEPADYAVQVFEDEHHRFQYWDVQALDDRLAPGMGLIASASIHQGVDSDEDSPLRAQGVLLYLSRSVHGGVTGATLPELTIRAKIGIDWYAVQFLGGDLPRLFISTNDTATWTEIRAEVRAGGSPAQAGGSFAGSMDRQLPISLFALNGILSITVGGMAVPVVTPLRGGNRSGSITNIGIDAFCWTQVGGSAHVICYAQTAHMLSTPAQYGFVPHPSTAPNYSVRDLTGARRVNAGEIQPLSYPPGATVQIGPAPGTEGTGIAQYELLLTNPYAGVFQGKAFSYFTGAITRVTTNVAGFEAPVYPAFSGVRLGTGEHHDVKAVSESIALDIAGLTIRHSARVTLSNWHGIDYLLGRYGIAGAGNIAMAIRLGYEHMADPARPALGFGRFYGFVETYDYERPSPGAANLVLSGCDQMQQLADCIIAAPPNMDGWNHYYAVAFLLQRAGIPLRRMAFAYAVPSDPYMDSPTSPLYTTPAHDFHLGLGSGSRPQTPVNRTLSVLEMLDTIRKVTGFLLYVDAEGMVRYEPFIPDLAGAPRRIFTETAGMDSLGAPTEMTGFRACITNRDTRNQVVLVGIDAFGDSWAPIVVKREDSASISSPPGAQPRNYVGYPKPFVWMDSRFADPAFAIPASNRLFRWLRQPQATVQFSCWLQPDLYPMDCIWVADSRSNSLGVPFYITNMQNALSVEGGSLVQQSHITATYLDAAAIATEV